MTKKIKVILHKGGFAGDLITALYDKTNFIDLSDNGKVNLNPKITELQSKNTLSLKAKNNLLQKNNVISVCDTEFAFIHRKTSLILYSSVDKMTKFFCERFEKYHPHNFHSMSIDDYVDEHDKWRDFWLEKFPNKLDMAKIFDSNFLDNVPFLDASKQNIDILYKWKTLNRTF